MNLLSNGRAFANKEPRGSHHPPSSHEGAVGASIPPPDRAHFDDRAAELLCAQRAQHEVLSSLVHELKGPLYNISLQTSVLERLPGHAHDISPQLQGCVSAIRRAIDQVAMIVSDLGMIDRPGEEGLRPDLRTHDTLALLESAVSAVQPLCATRGVHVSMRVREGATRLVCDRAQMLQALTALLLRAIRVTPPGGRVRVAASNTGFTTHLSVHDEGPLLDADALGQLLNGAVDDEESKRPFRIFSARRWVELHGGSLDAKPDEHGGMAFDAALPAHYDRGPGDA